MDSLWSQSVCMCVCVYVCVCVGVRVFVYVRVCSRTMHVGTRIYFVTSTQGRNQEFKLGGAQLFGVSSALHSPPSSSSTRCFPTTLNMSSLPPTHLNAGGLNFLIF